MTKDCVVIFGRELSEAEVELMRTNTGSKSFRCREWETLYVATALEVFCEMEFSDEIFFYDAIDYHSTLFLGLCDPAPIFIYHEEANTEKILGQAVDFWNRCKEIVYPLNRMSHPIRGHYKDLVSLGFTPKDDQFINYVDAIKSAVKADLMAVSSNCVNHLLSIKIFSSAQSDAS